MDLFVWAVDSLDADGYVAVFTEDAVIDSNGSISRRYDQIRKADRSRGRVCSPAATMAFFTVHSETLRYRGNFSTFLNASVPSRASKRNAR